MLKSDSGMAPAGGLSRREFVRAGGILAAAVAAGPARLLAEEPKQAAPPIPKRVLGRTGVEVSLLGLGTAPMGHRNNNHPDLPPLVEVFAEAVDRGVTY